MTLALLVGAGLLLRSFAHLRSTEIGVDPHNVLTMTVNLPHLKYSTLALRRQFFDQLVGRAAHTPGVEAAAISSEIPLEGGNNGYIKVEGETDPALANQLVGWNYITPDYFRTFRIPFLERRNFTLADLDRMAATRELFDLYKANSTLASYARDPGCASIRAYKLLIRTANKSAWWQVLRSTLIGVLAANPSEPHPKSGGAPLLRRSPRGNGHSKGHHIRYS
ncbi:MAG: hypothetical protein ACRD9L_21795 [Bryobacteraceae bacterium]